MSTIVHSTGTTAAAASVIPMPGRLTVSYYDWTLHTGVDPTLDEVPTGTVVNAAGTITAVVRLTGDRVMAVITGEDGHSAHVLLNADVVGMAGPGLRYGSRLTVRGAVFRTSSGQPAGIYGHGVHVRSV